MISVKRKSEKFKNAENPFTELFLLLRSHNLSNESLVECSAAQLRVIQQHSDNAMTILYQGLQDVGNMMGLLACNQEATITELNTIGFFISAISNLSEALNTLRLDADYILQQYYAFT